VLFFIAHASPRVWLAGCTTNPTGAWVTQQARNLGLDFCEQGVRVLIRDRDSKYSGPFDEVIRSEGIRIVKTPVRAPKANAMGGALRPNCARRMSGLAADPQPPSSRTRAARLRRPFQPRAPHRALELRPPELHQRRDRSALGEIRRRDRLGGLIHEYYRPAA
jgi:putative transposase